MTERIEFIAKTVDEAVKDVNKKLPKYKKIRSYDISETEFEKTTTKKIKRQVNIDKKRAKRSTAESADIAKTGTRQHPSHIIYIKNFFSSTKITIFARHIIKREKEYSLTANIYNDNDKKKEQGDATRFRGFDSRGEH